MAKTKRIIAEFKCKLCSKVFSERASLTHHMQLHKPEKPFSCKHCTFTCKTNKYLHRHVNRVHGKKEKEIECGICGKRFLYKHEVAKHMYTHTDERPFKCEVCNKGFNSRYSLSSHRYLHTGAKPYKCSFCEYACRDNSTLRKHQERHTGVSRVYQCTACDKSYKTKRVLKIHIAEVHMDLDLKTKPCSECGKLFKSLKSLNNHVKMSHLKLYTCKCEICGITLSSKYNMRAHLTSHIDYRPFKCSFEGCDKRYKDKCALKKHAIIHYPDKHFECSICKKKFSRLHRMHLHKKQHKAKKKCVFCDYCGKGFYNKNYIRSHITRKHMYSQHYICDLCGFKTYNKPSIVMHIKHGHVSEMDRKCKICKKTYKKHIYLKLHYWNTHSIKYKLNNHKLKKLNKKKKKTNNIIIEESSESDMKEIEIMQEVKVELTSDTEENKEGVEYSQGVLSEEINRAMFDNTAVTPDKSFKDFFIEHVIMPTTSNDEGTQQRETDIYVDVTCQKEAEKIRTEMLNRWKGNVGVKPFIRLKRHKDAALKLNNVKSEKIEITVATEDNDSNVSICEEKVIRKNRIKKVNRENTTQNRKVNDCEKINQMFEKFNNLFNENTSVDDEISKINQKISKVGEQIQNDLAKNSNHHKKQILKKLNRALTKYNNLVRKMNDIKNKESSPPIDDIMNGEVIERKDEVVLMIDQHSEKSEFNDEMTSSENPEDICNATKSDNDLSSMCDDEHGQNGKDNREMISLENDENRNDIIWNSISDENLRYSIHRDNYNDFTASVTENISGNITKTGIDPASTAGTNCKKLIHGATSSKNDENESVDLTEKYADELASIGKEHKEKSVELNSLENYEISGDEVVKSSDDQTFIGEENINSGDLTKLNDEVNLSENDASRNDKVSKTGDHPELITDENKCDELIQRTEYQTSIGDENGEKNESIKNDENSVNDNLDSGQVNVENFIQMNPFNSSDNGILYESSLAELVKLRKRKCVKNVNVNSNVDVSDENDFVYVNNLKEINNIIKEMDGMVLSLENDETLKNDKSDSRGIDSKNNSEKNKKSVISTRKHRRKRSKRQIKVSRKSEINRPKKLKEISSEEFKETNDELALSNNNEMATTENDEKARTENNETFNNVQSGSQENNEITAENFLEERDINKYWTRRSVRNHNRKVNTDLNSDNDFDSDDDMDQDFVPDDDDDDDNEESGDEQNKPNKFKFNSHQCYVCFKLYETKEQLLDHCKEHFDICNLKMLKKCPFCEFVTNLNLVGHVRLKHKVNLNYLYGTLKDRKNNNDKSRFYFNVENKSSLVNEVEVIPSILNLNRQAFLKIDRKRREKNDKEVKKTKLVKKDGEWVVEKVLINTKKENYVLPDKIEELLKNNEKDSNNDNDKNGKTNDENQTENNDNNEESDSENDKNDDNVGKEANNDVYCAKMQKLYRIAKKNSQKMLFPCNKCEKICQSLSALKLHLRRHDPNAKPFKKKVWKHKLSEEELKKLQENKQKSKTINKNIKNRYEKPKPIVNKHKCDPKLKDFYEKNIKGGDIEFWQFLKIFNKMTRENVNDFSDLENRTEFGNHFIDPELNPPDTEKSLNVRDINPSKSSGSSKSNLNLKPRNAGSSKSNSRTLVGKKGVANKVLKEGMFKRTILISRKDFLRRKAIKDFLRKKNITKSNTIT